MPETAARLRYYRVSPPKVRQVLRLIVGQDVNEARETLRFCERGPANPVMKLLDSAVANAEHNDNVPEDELFVVRAYADEGPTLKRGRPRARGRYGRIKKRTSHITIVVSRYDDDELERRRQREAAVAGPTRVSRRRRVAESRRRARAEAAAAHDHDHDEDHDEDVAEAEFDDEPVEDDGEVQDVETEGVDDEEDVDTGDVEEAEAEAPDETAVEDGSSQASGERVEKDEDE
jgi:large subunit ribosomal protein L22